MVFFRSRYGSQTVTGHARHDPSDIPLEILNLHLHPGNYPHPYLPFMTAAVAAALPLLTTSGRPIARVAAEFELAKVIQCYALCKRRHRGPATTKDVGEELTKLHLSLREAHTHYELLSKDARQVFNRLNLLKSALTSAMHDIEPRLGVGSKVGAPSNVPVEEAARMLVRLLMQWQPDTYKKTLTIMKDSVGMRYFASPGPQFVHVTLTAIDPSIAIGQIQTALKKLPAIQECASSG